MLKADDLEHAACPLGCPPGDEPVLSGRDLLHDLPGEFSVVRCRHCGLMRTDPRPTPDAIAAYYPEDYSPYVGTRVQNAAAAPPGGIKPLLQALLRKIIDFKTDALPALPAGRMLEIGCASGLFLHRMAGQGWQVQGIEFSEQAANAAAALGYPVHAGPLASAPEPAQPFDLIVGWMVLEHLHDPVGSLQRLRGWAKPDTWLVLSVPNAGSLEFRLFKKRWYALQLPTHLYHFSPDSIERVLAKAGWHVETIHHQRVLSNLIASLGYVLRDKGFSKCGTDLIAFPERAGKWRLLALYPLAYLLGLFGQTGRMTIWARVSS